MSKFQFGDMVRDEVLGVCVVLSTSEHFLTIQNANGNFNTIANPDHVEPIPHPDTARLDFLIKKGGAAFYENQVGDWQACAPSCLCEIADPEWSGFGSSPREAIDAAVKLSE